MHEPLEVGRALWVHPAQPRLQQGQPEQGAQAHVQTVSGDHRIIKYLELEDIYMDH